MKTKTTFKHLNNSLGEKNPQVFDAISSYVVQLVIKKTNFECITCKGKILAINFVPPSSQCSVTLFAEVRGMLSDRLRVGIEFVLF